MHAHSLCFLVAQCEQIDLPAQQEQRHQSKRHNRQDRKDFFHRNAAEAAHEPVCNGRKLIARIRDQLEIGRSGIKERTDDHTGQHKVQNALALRTLADKIHERDRSERKGEG